ncbi:hypothetical protein E2C01_061634 [Portunus trituberculatus]|uniref:Uncharacterized protein n=1 Tax=Portunus trituberculatus TaxID=210409 RepID=A0A5B7HEY5_PORTR|nr:hypothetical protein [Portunus trituberculatus]
MGMKSVNEPEGDSAKEWRDEGQGSVESHAAGHQRDERRVWAQRAGVVWHMGGRALLISGNLRREATRIDLRR